MYLKHGLYRFTLVAALFALTACSWLDGYSSTAHQQLLMLEQLHPVSYTHLTLPTIA